MDIFGQGVITRDEADGRVYFGLILAKGDKAAFFAEDAIPAFCHNSGIDSIMVDVQIDPTIPAVLSN